MLDPWGLIDRDLFASALRLSTPILLVALGALICERAGVINIAVEGIMLTGAFAGALGGVASGNPWWGVLAGLLAGALCGALLGTLTVTLRASQVVVGITLNVVLLGLTTFLYTVYLFDGEALVRTPEFGRWPIPLLSELPLLGALLFNQQPLVYLSLVLLASMTFFLYRTSYGLIVRATGERAQAVDAAGISVVTVRYACVIVGSALAALGGVYLALVEVGTFQPEMTAGRGFIGLAAIVFGKWTPIGSWLATLLFGFAEALQFRLQALRWVSPQLVGMLPYVLTILALAGLVGAATPPAEDGVPYVKE